VKSTRMLVSLVVAVSLLVSACAPTVQSYDPFIDSRLNCDELAMEIRRTRDLRAEAESNKGLSGQNVAWALLFWPGIFANEASNNDAIRVADERLRYLNHYYNERECTTLGLTGPLPASELPPLPAY